MKKIALIVGVDQYTRDSRIPDLNHTHADVSELARALRKHCGFEVTMLRDEQATREAIETHLRDFADRLASKDLFLFVFFGHGARTTTGTVTEQRILQYDARHGWRGSYLNLNDLYSDLRNINSRKVAIFDVCRDDNSGLTGTPARDASGITPRDPGIVPDDTAIRLLMFSCEPGKKAYEAEAYGHGVFAKYLIEAIRNVDEVSTGEVSAWRNSELECNKLAEVVKAAVVDDPLLARRNKKQVPVVFSIDEHIVLARRDDERKQPAQQAAPDRRGKWRSIPLLAAAALAFLLCVTWIWPDSWQAETNCPRGGARGISVVLLSVRDALSDGTRTNLFNSLEARVNDVGDGHLLELRILEPGRRGGRVAFSQCRPAGALRNQASEESSKRYRWFAEFRAAVEDVLRTSAAAGQGPSPIMATIREIAIDRLSGSGPNAQNALTVVSNLVEDSDDYSFLRGDTSFERFAKDPAYFKFNFNLNGAGVHLYYTPDTISVRLRREELFGFWFPWLVRNKANPTTFLIRDVGAK